MTETILRGVWFLQWCWIAVTWGAAMLAWWFGDVTSAGGVLLASFLLACAVVYVSVAATGLRALARRIVADWTGEATP